MKTQRTVRMAASKEGFKIGSTNDLRKNLKTGVRKLLYIKLKIHLIKKFTLLENRKKA